MTPAARLSAAIEVLDVVLDGQPAEKALTNWARAHRFAGSGDRAAIRDHVFDALRCRESWAQAGDGRSGRAVMLGGLVLAGTDPDALFTGARFAPDPLSAEERAGLSPTPPDPLLDLPAWLHKALAESLGAVLPEVASALRARAPVFLRVNTRAAPPNAVLAELRAEGFDAYAIAGTPGALRLDGAARRIGQSPVLTEGRAELQDLSPQRAVQALPDPEGLSVLDLCAGGGGKALALAARGARVSAHDISAARLEPLRARAARAGAKVALRAPGDPGGPYDMVLADVPCSGSGTWRRTPDAKWRLDPARLSALCDTQAQLLDQAAGLLRPGGVLSYMTCSLLRAENFDQIAAFQQRHSEFDMLYQDVILPKPDEGDGFFHAALRRKNRPDGGR